MSSADRRRQSRPVDTAKEAKRVLGAYRILETSPDGRAVLQDLCDAYYDVPTFVEGDPYATARNEGRREVVLAIFEVLDQLKEQKANRG